MIMIQKTVLSLPLFGHTIKPFNPSTKCMPTNIKRDCKLKINKVQTLAELISSCQFSTFFQITQNNNKNQCEAELIVNLG